MIRFKIKHYEYDAPVHTELYEFKTGVFFVFKDDEMLGFEMMIDEANLQDVINFGTNIVELMDNNYKVEANLRNYQSISCEFVDINSRVIKHNDINGVLIFLDSNNYLNINYYLNDGKLMDDVNNCLDNVCYALYSLIIKHLTNKKSI